MQERQFSRFAEWHCRTVLKIVIVINIKKDKFDDKVTKADRLYVEELNECDQRCDQNGDGYCRILNFSWMGDDDDLVCFSGFQCTIICTAIRLRSLHEGATCWCVQQWEVAQDDSAIEANFVTNGA